MKLLIKYPHFYIIYLWIYLNGGKTMPTYEYICSDCGEKFEIFATFEEKEKGLKLKCPKCGSKKVSQVFGSVFIINKSSSSLDSKGCSSCNGNSCSSCR